MICEGEKIMAMIRCPKCGKEVSDLGFKCIHCGHVLLKHEFFDTDYFQAIRCPRCGNYSTNTECDECGLPIDEYYFSEAGIEQNFSYQAFGRDHIKTAIDYYRKSASLGYAEAFNSLACLYEDGDGVQKDEREACALFYMAAQKGSSHGKFNLARCYEWGIGTKQSWASAVEWYEKAAKHNNIDAIYNLGLIYLNGREGSLDSIAVDYTKAYAYLKKATELGDSDAKAYLGIMYYNGFGVARSFDKALKYYKESSAEGSARGDFYLGICYYYGDCGVQVDRGKAIELIKRASKNGFETATNFLTQNNIKKK